MLHFLEHKQKLFKTKSHKGVGWQHVFLNRPSCNRHSDNVDRDMVFHQCEYKCGLSYALFF